MSTNTIPNTEPIIGRYYEAKSTQHCPTIDCVTFPVNIYQVDSIDAPFTVVIYGVFHVLGHITAKSATVNMDIFKRNFIDVTENKVTGDKDFYSLGILIHPTAPSTAAQTNGLSTIQDPQVSVDPNTKETFVVEKSVPDFTPSIDLDFEDYECWQDTWLKK